MGAAENKIIMREIFESGDRTKFVERLADHATMEVTGQYSWSQTFRGKESILRDLFGYVQSLLRERHPTEAFNYIADDDWVVVEARGNMVRTDGTPYRNHYCLLYRLENGMIVEMKEYNDSMLCERVLGPFPAKKSEA